MYHIPNNTVSAYPEIRLVIIGWSWAQDLLPEAQFQEMCPPLKMTETTNDKKYSEPM